MILNEVCSSVACSSYSCPHDGGISLSHTWSVYTIMPNNVRKEGACGCVPVSLGPDRETEVERKLQI